MIRTIAKLSLLIDLWAHDSIRVPAEVALSDRLCGETGVDKIYNNG